MLISYIAYKRQVYQKYSGSYFHFHYNSIIRIIQTNEINILIIISFLKASLALQLVKSKTELYNKYAQHFASYNIAQTVMEKVI